MEIVLHWFWGIKLFILIILFFSIYKAVYVHKFKNKLWIFVMGLLVLLNVFNPIKLKLDNTVSQQTKNIEATKQLPDKIIDDEFRQKSSTIKGITKEDLQ